MLCSRHEGSSRVNAGQIGPGDHLEKQLVHLLVVDDGDGGIKVAGEEAPAGCRMRQQMAY